MQIIEQLDENYQARMVAIQQSTQLEMSEIIKQAIDLMYEKTSLTPKEKNKKLIDMLAGIGSGPADLSENYKSYLSQGWKDKHDLS